MSAIIRRCSVRTFLREVKREVWRVGGGSGEDGGVGLRQSRGLQKGGMGGGHGHGHGDRDRDGRRKGSGEGRKLVLVVGNEGAGMK